MRRGRRLLALSTAIALGFSPAPARAESQGDAARAEALLGEARARLAAHDYPAACPKFAESQRLSPALRTLMSLASCYELAGRRASAWAAYESAVVAADTAGDEARFAAASRKAAELQPTLGHLVFSAPPSAHDAGYEVRCDGTLVPDKSWGDPLPEDPGPHEVSVRAPGHPAWTSRVELGAGAETVTVQVPTLELPDPYDAFDAIGPPPPSRAPEVLPAAVRAPLAAPRREAVGASQRTVGLAVGGAGVLGLAVGIIAGLEASSANADAKAFCNGNLCAPAGISEVDRARSFATVSSVAFITGAAALVAGGIVFFTAPDGVAVSTAVGPSGGALALSGRF